MSGLDELTKRYWSASFFIRRGRDRDKSVAIAILQQITETATGKVQNRAALILKESNVEQSGSAQE